MVNKLHKRLDSLQATFFSRGEEEQFMGSGAPQGGNLH